jgi:predicted phosphodiesterase
MRFLCVSDIHGNARAFEALLAEADRRGYERLLVAGDLCFPGPEPLGVWRLLMATRATMVQGLTDRALAALDLGKLRPLSEAEQARVARLRATREELGEVIVTRLGQLPLTARMPLQNGDELVLVHGSPVDPTEPMEATMSDEELSALLGDDPADLVVCGGSHVPFDRQVAGVRIVNVGSVGEAPGGDHAQGALIEVTLAGYEVELLSVRYERAA